MQRTMTIRAEMVGLLLVVAGPLIVSLPAVAGAASPTPVAQTTMTFVDSSRATPAWGGTPAKASRTLVTTIWYPAQKSGSAAASGHSSYPLIVFAHGLGGSPQQYQQLLTAWAAAGYVVAAPLFPLSNDGTPGGPDGGDIGNQPGDMSFVIDQVLKASAAPSGPLSGLVDPSEIGAAGHSNGGITTLGLVANSCCRDTRVKAAVVMAGTTEGLGRGAYDLAQAPPLLVVQDIHDGLVPYADAVAVFNGARGPKALLALDWDSPSDTTGSTAHMAASGVVGPTSAAVITSTTAFFNAFLKHEHGALQAVAADGRSSLSAVHTAWTWGPGPSSLFRSWRRATCMRRSPPTRACETVKLSPFGGAATPPARLSTSSSAPMSTSRAPARRAEFRPRSDPSSGPHRFGIGGPPRWDRHHRQRSLVNGEQLLCHRKQRQLNRPSRNQELPIHFAS